MKSPKIDKKFDITKMPDDELQKLFGVTLEELKLRGTNTKVLEIKQKLGGSSLQFRVHVWKDDPDDDEYGPNYSFYVVDGKKLRCFYYDFDDEEREKLMELIPDGFSEAMENAYDFRGTDTEARKVLKAAGFTDIVDGMPSHDECA